MIALEKKFGRAQNTNWDNFQIELEFRSVGFWGEGKTKYLEKNPSKDENQQLTQPTYDADNTPILKEC